MKLVELNFPPEQLYLYKLKMICNKTYKQIHDETKIKKSRDKIIEVNKWVKNNQTRDEQSILANSHANGIGFTSADARFMTLMAQYYIKHKKFSKQQMFIVRKNMMKYARQLVDHGLETGKIRKEGKYYVW